MLDISIFDIASYKYLQIVNTTLQLNAIKLQNSLKNIVKS